MEQLEEKLAHLEKVVDDLSSVVARQDTEIATLTRKVALLMEREVARGESDGGVVLGDERPPHY